MKTNAPDLVEVFEKHFNSKMINGDIESFKRDYLTLYVSVILPAMMDISKQSIDYVTQTYK